ncbi:hypothetical protein EVAR_37819_1 [Eumeta japonica]|uniref:Uncharacterized protein n=1 Tax=Eumeta variegata TaxID=151549 RepID=A0A4C1W9V7_EUMVA|nr:hypothetical protein EVAR_37819_1 [Eumeta japonica]
MDESNVEVRYTTKFYYKKKEKYGTNRAKICDVYGPDAVSFAPLVKATSVQMLNLQQLKMLTSMTKQLTDAPLLEQFLSTQDEDDEKKKKKVKE